MNKKYAVEFKNVSKIFKLKSKDNKFKNDKNQKFYALKNISFQVEEGEVVGILGSNGSGKSTLSSILAGISEVDSGIVNIRGEQTLISINIGLNNQLTGLENIKLKGTLLGLSKQKIEDITKGVIEFAELGDFLYQPVKKYSSGMKSRLGFAISINLDPDILIIDEALSVGDSGFAAKCMRKVNEFKEKGKTIFFISHSIGQVKEFCNKGLWIEDGVLREYGDIKEVADNYTRYINEYKKKSDEDKARFREDVFNKRLVKTHKKHYKRYRNKEKIIFIASGVLLAISILAFSYYFIKYK